MSSSNEASPLDPTPNPLRVVVRQPALPAYRVPFFQAVAATPSIDLTVIYGKQAGLPNVEPKGFKTVRLDSRRQNWRLVGDIELDQALLPAVEALDPDVVVLTWSPRIVSHFWHVERLRRRGIPVVFWGHGYSKTSVAGSRAGLAWLARRSALCICYSEKVARLWSADRPIQRFRFATNAIDTGASGSRKAFSSAQPSHLEEFALEHGLAGAGPILLFVSRLQLANDLHVAIEALPHILEAHPSATLVIVGDGDEERRRLMQVARSSGVDHAVRFESGIYDELVLARYFGLATMFCYPSNVGLSIQHSWAYGVPAIVGDRLDLHNPEIHNVVPGENAVLFEHGSSRSFAEELLAVLADPDRMASLRRASDETAARLTIDRMASEFIGSLREATHLRRTLASSTPISAGSPLARSE